MLRNVKLGRPVCAVAGTLTSARTKLVHSSTGALLLETGFLVLTALTALGRFGHLLQFLRRLFVLARLLTGAQLTAAFLDTETVAAFRLRTSILHRSRIAFLHFAGALTNCLIEAVASVSNKGNLSITL